MKKENFLITYYYRRSDNLFEALLPINRESLRFDNITKPEVDMFVEGLKIGLGDRLNGKIETEVIK